MIAISATKGNFCTDKKATDKKDTGSLFVSCLWVSIPIIIHDLILLHILCFSLLYLPRLVFPPSTVCQTLLLTYPLSLPFSFSSSCFILPLLLLLLLPLSSLSDSWWSKNKAGAPPAPPANYPFCQHSKPAGQWTRRAGLPALDQSEASAKPLDQSESSVLAAGASRSGSLIAG